MHNIWWSYGRSDGIAQHILHNAYFPAITLRPMMNIAWIITIYFANQYCMNRFEMENYIRQFFSKVRGGKKLEDCANKQVYAIYKRLVNNKNQNIKS